MESNVKVLLAGKNGTFIKETCRLLDQRGYQVERAGSLAALTQSADNIEYQVLVVDLDPGKARILEQIHDLCLRDSDLIVVVIGSQASVETAVSTLQSGATDYLCKPVSPDKVLQSIDRALSDKGILSGPAARLLREIGQRLRQRRNHLSLTLRQVARRSGLSVSLISQVERAQSAASVSSLYRLARALETPLSELFEGY